MPAKKPALRQHPIALGRGAKWWREQVRRNVSAIFDGLVRKGAKADRATMSRAYAFAIGSLVKHGYLKRTAKGLMVTDKGLAKSREKLRTVGARKKHEHFEKQLALVRKPRSRARRNPAPGLRWPDPKIAREIVQEDYEGLVPTKLPANLMAKLVAKGWPAEEIREATPAQAIVAYTPVLYERAMEREKALTERLTAAARGTRRALPAFLTAPALTPEERAEQELSPFALRMLETDPEGARKLGIMRPEDRAAVEEARKMRRYEMREIGGRAETYRFMMAQYVGEDGRDEWVLVTPAISGLRRAPAQAKVRKAMAGLRRHMIRELVEYDFAREVNPAAVAEMTDREVMALIQKYYDQHRLKYGQVAASQAKATVLDFMIGLAMAEDQPQIWPIDTPREELQQMLAPYADEATRLYVITHTRGKFDPVKVPGGWDFFWKDDVTASRAYVTQSRAAAAQARLFLDPVIVGRVQILRPEIERALMLRAGTKIGEQMEAETLRRRMKRQTSATRRRAEAVVMAADPRFASRSPEEQAEILRMGVLRATGQAPVAPTAPPVDVGSLFSGPRATFVPAGSKPAAAPKAAAPSSGTPDFSAMTPDEIFAYFARKNRGSARTNRRR